MQWKLEAIEDRAVFMILTGAKRRYRDGYLTRRVFWVKYAPARGAVIDAILLCAKFGNDPSRLECVLHA